MSPWPDVSSKPDDSLVDEARQQANPLLLQDQVEMRTRSTSGVDEIQQPTPSAQKLRMRRIISRQSDARRRRVRPHALKVLERFLEQILVGITTCASRDVDEL